MDCAAIQEKLTAYLEGMISPEEKLVIDEHLTLCQKCRESFADLKKTMEYVKNLEDVEPPAWLTQKVMERIKTEVKPKKGILQKLFYPLYIKLPLEAAAAILIVVTALYIFKTIHPEVKIPKVPSEEVLTQVPSVEKEKIPEKPTPAKKPETMDKAREARRIEKQYEIRPSVGASEKDELKKEVLSREPKAKALTERKEIINLTVNVKDIKTTSKEIEKVLMQLNGKIIKTESFDNRDIISAELDSKQVEKLMEKLKLIGEVKEKEVAFETREGYIEIKIEMVKTPTQP